MCRPALLVPSVQLCSIIVYRLSKCFDLQDCHLPIDHQYSADFSPCTARLLQPRGVSILVSNRYLAARAYCVIPRNCVAGTLEGRTLYTPAFIESTSAFLRGYLRGSTLPLSVSSLLKKQSFPNASAVSNRLLLSLLEDLLKDGSVKGMLTSSGLVYIPTVYLNARDAAVKAFYRQNGYIEFAMLKKWGISQPTEYMEGAFPGAIELQTMYASPDIFSEVSTASYLFSTLLTIGLT
jgi:hypothetical protein